MVTFRGFPISSGKFSRVCIFSFREDVCEVDMEVIKQIFNDLSSRGLIIIGLSASTIDGEIASKASVSGMGEKFIKFISE